MTTFRNLFVYLFTLLTGLMLVGMAIAQDSPSRGQGTSTLKVVTTPEKSPDPMGFIQRWLILDPINIGNQQAEGLSKAAVKVEYFTNQLTVLPKDGDKVTVNGDQLAWHALDTIHYNVDLYSFAYGVNRSASGVMFWAVTVVNCPQEMTNVRLAIGSNASSVWWVNGQEVTGVYGDRQTVIDDGVSKRLTLKKGPNIVRCVVINGSGATDFCARFLDNDGNPLKNFSITLGIPSN